MCFFCLCSRFLPVVEDVQVLPLHPPRAARRVPPGHLGAVLQLVLGEGVRARRVDLGHDLGDPALRLVLPIEDDHYFRRKNNHLIYLTSS